MEEKMSEEEVSILLMFCIGFAVGAGALPYTRAEALIEGLVRMMRGEA